MEQMTAPHKEMVLMKDCSHSPHYDEPEEFAEVEKKVKSEKILLRITKLMRLSVFLLIPFMEQVSQRFC